VVHLKCILKDGKVDAMNNIDIANGIVFQKSEVSKDSFDETVVMFSYKKPDSVINVKVGFGET